MQMPIKLTSVELEELRKSFADLLNYDSEDPTDQIDPLTYRHPDGDGCLHFAALRGDYRAMELLLQAGLDVNQQGDMGNTALHHAKRKGYRDLVDLLIAYGASENIPNAFGMLP
jgi:ankyrin repeat protein